NELSTKIVQILEPAVGQGKVRPQVSVSMSFEQVEETTEHYDPQGSVVRSQQKQDERQPHPQPAAGIPGPKAAQQAAAAAKVDPPPTPAGDNASTKQSEIVNYEVSKSVRHTVEPVGKIG